MTTVKAEYYNIKSKSSKSHILKLEINRIGQVLRQATLCKTVATGKSKYEVSPLDGSKVTCYVCRKLGKSELNNI